jgi:ElaB/YqjD/DUF883 family membrane-anchored ribosome-binding protein
MPFTPEIEGLIALEKDATKQATMRKELEDGYRRQADYSREMNALAKQKKDWTDWHADVDKQYKAAMADVKMLRDTVAELEKAKGALPDDGSGDGDANLNKALREARAELNEARTKTQQLEVTVTDFNKKLEDGKILTAEKFEEMFTKGLDNAGAAMFDIIDKQNKCLTDYGQPLDRNALIVKAQELKGDLNMAYEILTAPMKEAKLRKDIEADYEKKFNDRIKAANLPMDQGSGGEPTLGPLQSRIQKKDTGIPDDIPADGSGQLASRIAQELRAEGKG